MNKKLQNLLEEQLTKNLHLAQVKGRGQEGVWSKGVWPKGCGLLEGAEPLKGDVV